MNKRFAIAGMMVCLLAWAVPGFGLEPEEAENLVFYFENDTFGGTDENYSNAVKISWTSEDIDEYTDGYEPGDVPVLGGFWSGEGYQRNFGFSVGQNIYTPEDTDTEELVEDDRPYAGLLYLAFALHRKTPKILDTLELTLGLVGPASLAEESQKLVHDILDIDSPEGWDNQLDNEPGIALTWQRSWRAVADGGSFGWGWDLIPHFGVTLGNISTFANAGFGLRFGYNVPQDFGTSLIRPAATVLVPTAESDPRLSQKRDFGIVWFARAEGRGVAYNVFLDGNTFEDSHSVDKEYFVADLSAGISILYKSVKLSYAQVYRTEEFEEQDGGHTFGSVALSITY
ncbi:MAG: lipid A deacylase LpxR family protein [Thermodesulfobacteriota bacterium]